MRLSKYLASVITGVFTDPVYGCRGSTGRTSGGMRPEPIYKDDNPTGYGDLRSTPEYQAAMRAIRGQRPNMKLNETGPIDEPILRPISEPILMQRDDVESEMARLNREQRNIRFSHIDRHSQQEFDTIGRKIDAYQLALEDADNPSFDYGSGLV